MRGQARKRDSRQRQRIDPNIAHVDAAFDRLDKRAVERGVMCDHRATTDKIGESGDGLNGRRGICHIGICNARELGNLGGNQLLIEDAVSSGTPQFVIDSYATLAERAKTQSFGLIEEDVIVLDTETTGLSVQDNELIEISAARLSGREIVDRFDTFVHPKQLIPAEITETG